MKIALAQLNYHIGNFELNTAKILGAIQQATEQGADLIVFSELAICGYPPQDLLERSEFIDRCIIAINKIAIHSKQTAVLIGGPSLNKGSKGKSLFNSCYFLAEGKIAAVVNKTLLPTYDVFDEYRYFEPNTHFELINYKGMKIAVTICEDLWDEQPQVTPMDREKPYKLSPLEELSKQNPDMIINIAASPFAYTRIQTKQDIFSQKAKRYGVPVIYVNQTGGHTELVFEGNSMVFNRQGLLVKRLAGFSEDIAIADTGILNKMAPLADLKPDNAELIHDALICGIKDFFAKTGFTRAVLGLSGGIDSAITLVLASRALAPENVHALLMPSKYSSAHSIDDSVKLATHLGITHDIISIEPIVNSFHSTLQPFFNEAVDGVTEENIQSRIRAVLLMAYSNKYGYILLNTSNKSEAAVGYGTLYGDMAGGLSVLGDVYKSKIYELAGYINRHEEIIPHNIIEKPPSAELRPNQKDTDSLPEYSLLDQILYKYIEQQLAPSAIIEAGYNEQLVKKVVQLVNTNEYKRYQTPPMLRVSPKAFGIGRRMPIAAKY